jgi:hypothetical protein
MEPPPKAPTARDERAELARNIDARELARRGGETLAAPIPLSIHHSSRSNHHAHHDGLAVDDGAALLQGREGEGSGNARHAVSPIEAASGVDTDIALIDDAYRPVAVMLNLMQPFRTCRRFPRERGDGGRDPRRGQVEEACLLEIEAGCDDAADDALGFGIRAALDGASPMPVDTSIYGQIKQQLGQQPVRSRRPSTF